MGKTVGSKLKIFHSHKSHRHARNNKQTSNKRKKGCAKSQGHTEDTTISRSRGERGRSQGHLGTVPISKSLGRCTKLKVIRTLC